MDQSVLEKKDRRLFKRYELKKPCLVSGDNIVGLIKDLSCGGCSFHYVKKKGQDSGAVEKLCIEPLGMAEVEVEVIEDRPSIEEGEHCLATMHLRRVKFVGLNLLQLRSLQEYIRRKAEFADEEKTVENAAAEKMSLLPPRSTRNAAVAPAVC